MHPSTLLRRIRCLFINFYGQSGQFSMGLQDLTELIIVARRGLHITLSAFPKLLSLTIWDTQLEVDENTEFPVLDRLTLHEDWSGLPLIVAPKLTKLILRCIKTFNKKFNIPPAILLRRTVQPTSLVLSDASLVIDLPELLTVWSGLLELHLEYYEGVNVMSQVQLAMLGGNSDHGRLCPHLRYLTVHVSQGQPDPTMIGQIIQTLQTIVEERKRYDKDELRRVMCVWEDWGDTSGIEWVDVL